MWPTQDTLDAFKKFFSLFLPLYWSENIRHTQICKYFQFHLKLWSASVNLKKIMEKSTWYCQDVELRQVYVNLLLILPERLTFFLIQVQNNQSLKGSVEVDWNVCGLVVSFDLKLPLASLTIEIQFQNFFLTMSRYLFSDLFSSWKDTSCSEQVGK